MWCHAKIEASGWVSWTDEHVAFLFDEIRKLEKCGCSTTEAVGNVMQSKTTKTDKRVRGLVEIAAMFVPPH